MIDKENYCQLISKEHIERKQSWFVNILVSLDQFGNTLAKGNPDNTISARIGYFMHNENGNPNWFWKLLENVVNFTFKPLDGIEHCFVAYCYDKDEKFEEGDLFAKIVLFIFVVVFSIPFLIIVVYIVAFLFPKAKNEYKMDHEKVSLEKINNFRKKHCASD
ncbi:hypothetical protein C7447_101942 [Tenacibaculum adriaticum]|uniref:Uncharacterized protein n=1 Tax=Tenacibaculum adriaticum TaxID=413713 RepID=A0A5S5E0S9_9FLAO|nr:hypothetical protein [Tenacibaculum adriaticum]TYQ00330.1 hypothetical protein C7447_101942 [Tenacibaculum adriaticum]